MFWNKVTTQVQNVFFMEDYESQIIHNAILLLNNLDNKMHPMDLNPKPHALKSECNNQVQNWNPKLKN